MPALHSWRYSTGRPLFGSPCGAWSTCWFELIGSRLEVGYGVLGFTFRQSYPQAVETGWDGLTGFSRTVDEALWHIDERRLGLPSGSCSESAAAAFSPGKQDNCAAQCGDWSGLLGVSRVGTDGVPGAAHGCRRLGEQGCFAAWEAAGAGVEGCGGAGRRRSYPQAVDLWVSGVPDDVAHRLPVRSAG